jgi:hypothetical protein
MPRPRKTKQIMNPMPLSSLTWPLAFVPKITAVKATMPTKVRPIPALRFVIQLELFCFAGLISEIGLN